MYIVIIPVGFLIAVSTVKKIPLIGGKLLAAFCGAGLLAMLLGGVYNPLHWVRPWLTSLNQLSYIIWIVIFGAIFSTLQIDSGAMETVLNTLRAIFGKTPQGLVFSILLALYLGGSLVGTVTAVGAVVGLLIVPVLDDMGMPPELICATIVTGGSMGAIMPPISNAINVASGIIGIDPMPVIQIGYVTVGIGLIYTSLFFCKVYVGRKYSIPKHLIPKERPLAILGANWKTLIPLMVLILLVMLNSIPSIRFNLPAWLLGLIPTGGGISLYGRISAIPVLGTITNNIVMSLIIAIGVTYLACPALRRQSGSKIRESLKTIRPSVLIQVGAAFFLGAFTIGGQMEAVAVWAESLNQHLIKLGGGSSLLLGGMLLGAQSTSQTLLTPIVGPAWMATGVTQVNAAVASAHLAAAGQGLPPADMNTFMIAGLVSSILHKKVDPMRSMMYTIFYCIYLAAVGFLFLYL